MNRMVGTLILCALVCGCIEKVEKKSDLFDKTQAIAACEQMIEQFQATLKQELVRAMADGGPVKAISVCNLRAPIIADSFSTLPGFDIRRVSLRQRNHLFQPDSFEIATLQRFVASGVAEPQAYSELAFDSGATKTFRYMKEIKVGQVCLNCHGDPGGFSANLKSALAETYPDDVAVGYRTGESRGAFSVVVRYPAARESITELLSEQGK